jgi:hypothetical protein
MESLLLESTSNTPSVNFNADSGVLLIEGRSIPEHANMFFDQLINWAKQYVQTNPPKTEITIKIDYLNSSSHKFLFDFFEKFETIHLNGNVVSVNWYYERDDEEMKETGKEYKDNINVPFTINMVEEF